MGLIRDEQKPYALYNEVGGGDFDRIGDGTSLVDCGIQDGSHIYLFFRSTSR
ncbi:hypothetical protein NC653_037574 [Populus alba x Populus x berolinensis]|uniref:Ubiquitin-like domain-containing protein n=1 Tax=Populus alba x Populus x berolinensis TaxID=444605 RepID=A0AAD6PS47_9ROSI|nr:hypothetical protein NC653_037574 [Populus alba x Populus x berolinensis]